MRVWPSGAGGHKVSHSQFLPLESPTSWWACVAGRTSPLQVTINRKDLQVIKNFKQINYFQKEKKKN